MPLDQHQPPASDPARTRLVMARAIICGSLTAFAVVCGILVALRLAPAILLLVVPGDLIAAGLVWISLGKRIQALDAATRSR